MIRTDLPLADQIVQVGHACLEAGFKFSKPEETINLVLLGVATETQLLATLEKISTKGIQAVVFHEPDKRLGFTAVCTEPLHQCYRREFRKLRLWKAAGEAIET